MSEQRTRYVWFAVFMIWLGMVSSILVYHTVNKGLNSAQSAPDDQIMDVNKNAGSIVIEKMPTDQEEKKQQEGQNQTQDHSNVQMAKVQEQTSDKGFFVQYRLDRDKVRQEQLNNYRDMVNNPNTDPSIKKTAQERMLRLTKQIEQEMEIESLIRARGFKDVLAFMHDDSSINLIIQTDGLTEIEVAKIGDVVTQITDLRAEDISILEKRLTKSQ